MAILARSGGEIAAKSANDITTEGWDEGSTINVLPAGTFAAIPSRKASNGLGGSYYLGSNSAISNRSGNLRLSVPTPEFWVFMAIKRSSFTNGDILFRLVNSSANPGAATNQSHVWIQILGGDGRIRIQTENESNSLVERAVSVDFISTSDNAWNGLWIYAKIDAVDGVVEVYLSDPAGGAVPSASFYGKTKDASFGSDVGFINTITSIGTALDDIRIQNASILFNAGSGATVEGNTVNFYDAGVNLIGSATISYIEGDLASVGRLHLINVQDHLGNPWDGLRDNDPLIGWASATSAAWSGSPVQASLEQTSGFPLDAYQISHVPDAAGGLTQLTSSTIDPNWENVNDGIDSSADANYNSSATIGHADRYQFEDPPDPSLISKIDSVGVYLRVQEQGASAINNTAALAELSGTEVEAIQKQIPAGGYQIQRSEFSKDPNGNEWTRANLQASEFGIRMKG